MLTSMERFRDEFMPKELECLRDFLDDAPRPGKIHRLSYEGPVGSVYGWKGPYMAGYGVGDDIRLAVNRARKSGDTVLADRGRKWLRSHALQYCEDFWRMHAVKGRGAGEGLAYWRAYIYSKLSTGAKLAIPLGSWREGDVVMLNPGVAETIEELQGEPYSLKLQTHKRTSSGWKLVFDESDFGRHDNPGWLVDYLLDELSEELSPTERETLEEVLVQSVRDKLSSWRTKPPKPTERHRMFYGVGLLVDFYRYAKAKWKYVAEEEAETLGRDLTAEELEREELIAIGLAHREARLEAEGEIDLWLLGKEALEAAEAAVEWAFTGQAKTVIGRDGWVFQAWDMSDPRDPAWHSLNGIYEDHAWYWGLWTHAFWKMLTTPDVRGFVKHTITNVIEHRLEWCDRSDRLPTADLERMGDGAVLNGMVQGGFLPDEWPDRFLRVGRRRMTGREYLELDDDTPFMPITCLKVWVRDSNVPLGGYLAQYWPSGTRDQIRIHYPRKTTPVGIKLDITGGAWCAMVDFLFLKWVGSGKVEDLEYALMVCDHYWRFFHLLHSGDTLTKRKKDGAKKWYGTAAGNSRALYWLLTGSKILKGFVFDHPEFVHEWTKTKGALDVNWEARVVEEAREMGLPVDPRDLDPKAEHMRAELDE